VVGEEGFEPPTLWSQTRCATKLRYSPTLYILNLTRFILSDLYPIEIILLSEEANQGKGYLWSAIPKIRMRYQALLFTDIVYFKSYQIDSIRLASNRNNSGR
jgi:hypothetical protein